MEQKTHIAKACPSCNSVNILFRKSKGMYICVKCRHEFNRLQAKRKEIKNTTVLPFHFIKAVERRKEKLKGL